MGPGPSAGPAPFSVWGRYWHGLVHRQSHARRVTWYLLANPGRVPAHRGLRRFRDVRSKRWDLHGELPRHHYLSEGTSPEVIARAAAPRSVASLGPLASFRIAVGYRPKTGGGASTAFRPDWEAVSVVPDHGILPAWPGSLPAVGGVESKHPRGPHQGCATIEVPLGKGNVRQCGAGHCRTATRLLSG